MLVQLDGLCPSLAVLLSVRPSRLVPCPSRLGCENGKMSKKKFPPGLKSLLKIFPILFLSVFLSSPLSVAWLRPSFLAKDTYFCLVPSPTPRASLVQPSLFLLSSNLLSSEAGSAVLASLFLLFSKTAGPYRLSYRLLRRRPTHILKLNKLEFRDRTAFQKPLFKKIVTRSPCVRRGFELQVSPLL